MSTNELTEPLTLEPHNVMAVSSELMPPSDPGLHQGDVVFDTSEGKMYVWAGSAWTEMAGQEAPNRQLGPEERSIMRSMIDEMIEL